jgi:hypothetical protein
MSGPGQRLMKQKETGPGKDGDGHACMHGGQGQERTLQALGSSVLRGSDPRVLVVSLATQKNRKQERGKASWVVSLGTRDNGEPLYWQEREGERYKARQLSFSLSICFNDKSLVSYYFLSCVSPTKPALFTCC